MLILSSVGKFLRVYNIMECNVRNNKTDNWLLDDLLDYQILILCICLSFSSLPPIFLILSSMSM